MLDLKKLEEKIDRALENETSDSLSKWLFEKRTKSFLTQLGSGRIEMMKSYKDEIIISKTKISLQSDDSVLNYSSSSLGIAA